MKSIFYLSLLFPYLAFSQLSKKDSLWLPFKDFIGEWKGRGTGVDGDGSYDRSYRLILNNNYIEVKNKTTYAPTKQKPNGYHHEDIGYISYDKQRKAFVFRQFHIEGFVNEYKLESISADKKKLVFVSESIENIPAGWRARETYIITDQGIMEEFDLAEPGKEYEKYTRAHLVRK
jgi:hypothetical protein